jgi:hypothetical protein
LVTAWTELSPEPVAVNFDTQGAPGAVTLITDQRMPFGADAGGNLILSAPYVGTSCVRASARSSSPRPAAQAQATVNEAPVKRAAVTPKATGARSS